MSDTGGGCASLSHPIGWWVRLERRERLDVRGDTVTWIEPTYVWISDDAARVAWVRLRECLDATRAETAHEGRIEP